MSTKPVILDVDPGHDDAVALMMACGSPDLDLLAVTTVAGNVPLEKTTRNALRVLSLVGHTHVPVAAGAAAPLCRPLHTAEDIHGESGLEGTEIPEAGFASDKRGAVDLIVNTPLGRGARGDGYEIRRAALGAKVPCITTMAGASAAVQAMARAWNVEGKPLQELHLMNLVLRG